MYEVITEYMSLTRSQVTERSEVACPIRAKRLLVVKVISRGSCGSQITEYMPLTRSQATERSEVACECYLSNNRFAPIGQVLPYLFRKSILFQTNCRHINGTKPFPPSMSSTLHHPSLNDSKI